jgi:hypothetical protein
VGGCTLRHIAARRIGVGGHGLSGWRAAATAPATPASTGDRRGAVEDVIEDAMTRLLRR